MGLLKAIITKNYMTLSMRSAIILFLSSKLCVRRIRALFKLEIDIEQYFRSNKNMIDEHIVLQLE
jgi:hypothetical protein